mmetsp:Transcript_40015/g.61484  ORF Transcript_40015/g.61484 Transcript_40015/m.61484 type:complete len:171 (+) Transcript_40015:24-536(+)
MAGTGKEIIQTKLVFLGEAAVGKSSIVLRFVKDEFSQNSESTIGAAFLTAQIDINERQTVKYEIWDTAGQERFHSLAPMYYRGAQAAIVVYDITSPASFDRAKSWISELQVEGNPDVVIALAGNKADMEDARAVSDGQAQVYAEKLGLVFLECSAKSGKNIKELFNEVGT